MTRETLHGDFTNFLKTTGIHCISFYERFKTVREGKMPVPFQGKMFHAPGFQYNGSPILLSEFGDISYVPLRPMCPTILGATKAWSVPKQARSSACEGSTKR